MVGRTWCDRRSGREVHSGQDDCVAAAFAALHARRPGSRGSPRTRSRAPTRSSSTSRSRARRARRRRACGPAGSSASSSTPRRPGPGVPVNFVRVQPVASGMILRDLQAVMGPNLTGILLPKITGPADVHAADAILDVSRDRARPARRRSTMLYPILENAQAIRNAYEIATASRARRVHGRRGVALRRHRAPTSASAGRRRGTETLYIREKVLIDARAAGIRYPISGMWGGANDDLDGLRVVAHRAARHRLLRDDDGQRASTCPIVNAAFTPTADEVAYWSDIDRLDDARPKRADEQVIYGDTNQGEGHEIHIAHVATGAQAARVGPRAGRRGVTEKAADVRAGLSHPIIDADGHFVELAPLFDEEMLTYLEEMGGRAVRDRYARNTGLTDTSTVLAAHPGARGPGWKAMPSWWGWPTKNTRDRATVASPRAALRAARRDRHRLHDPVSVDDALLPRDRRRRAHRPALPRREPRARQPVRAVPRPHDRRRARPDARSEARGRRARVRGARARLQDRRVRRPRAPRRSAIGRARTGSTRSASTARSTTTRCGPSASSSGSRPCSTARCSRTG